MSPKKKNSLFFLNCCQLFKLFLPNTDEESHPYIERFSHKSRILTEQIDFWIAFHETRIPLSKGGLQGVLYSKIIVFALTELID
jgi:hypothetical protein